LNLRFETDGHVVHTRFVPSAAHIGFKQTVHGGLLATVLDEIMVWACAVQTKRFAFCAELNVRYLNSARPTEELVATAQMVADRRGKLFEASAEVKNIAGLVLAHATGKYLPIKPAQLAGMAGDFVDDASWLFAPPA
jgi:uncharacterized protein (TIGR00369 family)